MSQKSPSRSWLSVAATLDKQRARGLGPVTEHAPRADPHHSPAVPDTPTAVAVAAGSADRSGAAAAPSRSWLSVAATLGGQRTCSPLIDRAPRAGQDPRRSTVDTAIPRTVATGSADHSHPSAAHAASRLHRHALECIFAFLGLQELAAAMRVARSWMGVVSSMRRLQLSVKDPAVPLSLLAQSPLGRHVAVIGGEEHENTVCLSAADLVVLADQMGHLRGLHCEIALSPPGQPLRFPANLRLLHVDLGPAGYNPHDSFAWLRLSDADVIQFAAPLAAQIAAVSRLSLLEELRIWTPPELSALLSFAPLGALPRLRDLFVKERGGRFARLTDAQADEIGAMPLLRKVDAAMTTPQLRRLLQLQHKLLWQQIELTSTLDEEAAALLPLLPSLTTLDVQPECDDFDWLRGLPNLTAVDMEFVSAGAAGRCASMVAGLQCCTNIQMLTLKQCYRCEDLTAAHLAELLPRLPRLRELELDDLAIDSLSFLSQPPLATQLRRLCVSFCKKLPVAELRHVHALRSLTHLDLFFALDAPLSQHEQSLLTPPSAVMPHLAEFKYSAPCTESDFDCYNCSDDDDDDEDGEDADGDFDDDGGDFGQEPWDGDSGGDSSDDDEADDAELGGDRHSSLEQHAAGRGGGGPRGRGRRGRGRGGRRGC